MRLIILYFRTNLFSHFSFIIWVLGMMENGYYQHNPGKTVRLGHVCLR